MAWTGTSIGLPGQRRQGRTARPLWAEQIEGDPFLLSDAAAYITGADLPVDGDFTAHGGAKNISDALLSAD